MAPASSTIVVRTPAYPLHVILAAYPIACFTGAFLTDIAYANTFEMQWANFSVWLITAGLAMGLLATIAGVADFLANRRTETHRRAWPHALGNVLVMLLSLLNVFIHSRDGYTSVVPAGIILSGAVAVLVLVMSWIGTSLTLRSHLELDK